MSESFPKPYRELTERVELAILQRKQPEADSQTPDDQKYGTTSKLLRWISEPQLSMGRSVLHPLTDRPVPQFSRVEIDNALGEKTRVEAWIKEDDSGQPSELYVIRSQKLDRWTTPLDNADLSAQVLTQAIRGENPYMTVSEPDEMPTVLLSHPRSRHTKPIIEGLASLGLFVDQEAALDPEEGVGSGVYDETQVFYKARGRKELGHLTTRMVFPIASGIDDPPHAIRPIE